MKTKFEPLFGMSELMPHEPPDFSVVIVCLNNRGYLSTCLHSLFESQIQSRFEVIVVDNGSTDGSQDLLKEEFPQVEVIQNEENMGLSKASNQGIVASSGRYVLLLNDDTLVDGPSLDALVAFLDATPDAGAAGGRLLNPDGSFQAADSRFPSLWEEFLITTRLGAWIWPNYPDRGYSKEIKVVEWIGSACLFLRRAALIEVGLLDESYFIYGDEADLQFRLKRAGWNVYYLPEVITVHYGGRSLDRWRRRKMVYRGKLLFFRKNYGLMRTFLLRALYALLSIGKIFLWISFLLSPQKHAQARAEIRSNADIISLCLALK